jgi:molybdopterin-guanine dinucleotide biosynthesis adapter protein
MSMQVFGFAGWSGSGKTTLIEQVIPRLIARGHVVSLVKHAHHRFDIDQPGKDSWRHRHAGSREVLLTSATRWALMHELRGGPELTLAQALAQLGPCDFALVEGFKFSTIPKLEVFRASVGKPALHPSDPTILGVVTDDPLEPTDGRPVLRFAAIDEIATFIVANARPVPPDN